ncbi:NUDIX hydrolase [Patescibacteria group bacterium]
MKNKTMYQKIRKNNPVANVIGIVLNTKKKILLLKRVKPPYKNYWTLPGGAIEGNEKVESAMIREMHEETGLKVIIKALVGIHSGGNYEPRYPAFSIVFLLKAKNSKVIINKESVEWKWFSLRKLPSKIGFGHKKWILLALS